MWSFIGRVWWSFIGRVWCVILIYTASSVAVPMYDGDEFHALKEEGELNVAAVSRAISKYPDSGPCFHGALEHVKSGCDNLTEEEQFRIAYHLLSCFLKTLGRHVEPCFKHEQIDVCFKKLEKDGRDREHSYQTYFNQVVSMCFFLKSQAWQTITKKTITALETTSQLVAKQVEMAGARQKEILSSQNEALQLQSELQAEQQRFSKGFSASAELVERSLQEVYDLTDKTHRVIDTIFDRLASIEQINLDQYLGLYFFLFWCGSVVACYILTSTSRTAAARASLYFLTLTYGATEYFLLPGLVFSTVCETLINYEISIASPQVCIYLAVRYGRMMYVMIAMCVLLYTGLSYVDYGRESYNLLTGLTGTIIDLKAEIKHIKAIVDYDYVTDDSDSDWEDEGEELVDGLSLLDVDTGSPLSSGILVPVDGEISARSKGYNLRIRKEPVS